jgi:hypothetical protein
MFTSDNCKPRCVIYVPAKNRFNASAFGADVSANHVDLADVPTVESASASVGLDSSSSSFHAALVSSDAAT